MLFPQAQETLAFALSVGTSVFLWGPPGCGKSDMARGAVAAVSRPLVETNFNTCESLDLRGLPRHDPATDSVHWSRPDFVRELYEAGPNPVLFIDEANAAGASIQVALFQITLEHRIGSHRFPAGTSVVLAGNRQSDRAAAQRMPTALANRLLHIDVEASVPAWLKWAALNRLHPALVAFMTLRGEGQVGKPGMLHAFDPSKPEVRAFPSPRSWAQAERWIDAPDSIRHGAIAGIVGEGAAAELEGFIQVYRNLPPLPQIINDPDNAPVSRDVSVMYCVTIALSRAANGANFGNIIRYFARMGKEFETMGVTDAVRRNPSLCNSTPYTYWAAENSAVAI